MTLKMWMKLLLAFATFVHVTDHMHIHLKVSSLKKKKGGKKTPNKTPNHTIKKSIQQKQQQTILRTKTECLYCSPAKELHALEGHCTIQSGWIFLEERMNSVYTQKFTFLHSTYLPLLLQNNKDTLLSPNFSRETLYTHLDPFLTISLPKNSNTQAGVSCELHNIVFKSCVSQQN